MKQMFFSITRKATRLIAVIALAICSLSIYAQGKLDYTGFKQVYPGATDGSEYLYETTFHDYDYDAALKTTNFLCSEWNDDLFSTISADDLKNILSLTFQGIPDSKSSCCEIRKGQFYGRNLDGFWNSYANLIMRIEGSDDRLASICMGRIETLGTKSAIDSGLLPGFVINVAPMFASDGMNEAGVCVALNSLPRINMTRTTGTNPGKPRICEGLLPRVILDKAHSVQEAIDIINNSDIFAPYNPTLSVYRELHYLISDHNETALVEILNNKVYIERSANTNYFDETKDYDTNIMTNTWQTQYGTEIYDQLCQSGTERYRIMKEHYNDAENAGHNVTADDVMDILKRVWFSQVFYGHENVDHPEDYWVTDYLWNTPWYQIKPGSTNEEGKVIKQQMCDMIDLLSPVCTPELLKAHRPATVESTLHSSVYDMDKKTLTLIPAQIEEKKLTIEMPTTEE